MAAGQTPSPAGPVRVGSQLMTPQKIKDVQPIYPPVAKAAGVEGIVILELTIVRDGKVQNVKVLRSIPLLDQAAIDAVKRWEYVPTLLNGGRVPVIVTATVTFALPRQADYPVSPQAFGSADQRPSDDMPKDSVPQNTPCPDQPKTLTALKESFNRGRIPSRAETTGSWVAICFFGDYNADLNCAGLLRATTFEEVMTADRGYLAARPSR
jgi:TonB family protein